MAETKHTPREQRPPAADSASPDHQPAELDDAALENVSGGAATSADMNQMVVMQLQDAQQSQVAHELAHVVQQHAPVKRER